MRRQFTERFALIRAEFDRVFKELFGGGHGSLADGGRGHPGGRDPDHLTASWKEAAEHDADVRRRKSSDSHCALICDPELKPSPFCLLDEIEAALDDSNVDRYAKYLHKLTKHTQFIVITHRRGTMVAADRLYGITMQEKGVSTLVSVSPIENDLDK